MTPPISLKMDTTTIERGFKECPAIMAKYVTEGLKRVLLGFRKDFFAQSPVKLRTTGKGLGRNKYWPINVTNVSRLGDIAGSLHTGSPAAFAHETGATILPTGGRKFLARPIGLALNKIGVRRKGYLSPAAARARGLRFVTVKAKSGALILRQFVKQRGRRGRRRKGEAAPSEILGGPAWLLVRSIHLRPRLNFIGLWEKMLPNAERRFAERIDDAVAEAFRTKGVNLRG